LIDEEIAKVLSIAQTNIDRYAKGLRGGKNLVLKAELVQWMNEVGEATRS